MLTIVVELDSRSLWGSMLLLPFDVAWLSSNSCRDMLKLGLTCCPKLAGIGDKDTDF